MSDYPVIPELPDPPLRTDGRVDFARKGSVFIGALPGFRTAVNSAGAFVQQTASDLSGAQAAAESARDQAQGYANSAANSSTNASGAANNANIYAQLAASSANFKGEWGDLTGGLIVPSSVFHDGVYWQLLIDVADVTLSEPGVSGDWAAIDVEQITAWTAISTSTTLTAGGSYAVTFGSPLNLTLPGSPANNDSIKLYRSGGDSTGSVIIRNGQTIMGVAEDMTIDLNITSLELVFNGSDWRIL